MILRQVPEVTEGLRFGRLTYFLADAPYPSIGGHVCSIGEHRGRIRLSFIQGALLPDPLRLLQGSGKAMRHLELHSEQDLGRPGLAELVRASAERAALARDDVS